MWMAFPKRSAFVSPRSAPASQAAYRRGDLATRSRMLFDAKRGDRAW